LIDYAIYLYRYLTNVFIPIQKCAPLSAICTSLAPKIASNSLIDWGVELKKYSCTLFENPFTQ